MNEINSFSSNDPVTRNLEKALDGAALRQKVIANNLANVDTPNFKRSDVSFQGQLQQSLQRNGPVSLAVTDPQHMNCGTGSGTGAMIIQDNSSTFRKDGNNVDIDRETVEMVKNNMYYNAAVQMLTTRFGMIRLSIEE